MRGGRLDACISVAAVQPVAEVAEHHTTMLACAVGCDAAGIIILGARQSCGVAWEVKGCLGSGRLHVTHHKHKYGSCGCSACCGRHGYDNAVMCRGVRYS